MAAILLLPTLTLSVSMGVFAIRILQFSTLLGWFTPTFLSSRKPDGQQKTNLELYQMNWSHNVKDFYCRCISWNYISTLELWNSALVWKVKINTTRNLAVNKNQIWRSTRWAGLIMSQTSTVVYLLKLNLWSQSLNPCLGLLGLRGEKVATSNPTVNKNQTWSCTRWVDLITSHSRTSTGLHLLKLHLNSWNLNPCFGLTGEKVTTRNMQVIQKGSTPVVVHRPNPL